MNEGKRSGTKHAELADLLSEEIASERYPIGGRFPTEEQLQERFNVGRHTIREALKVLTEQGMLGRRRKTGTTVLSLQPVAQYVHSLRDLKGLLDFAERTVLEVHHRGYISVTDRSPVDFLDLPEKRWFRIAGLRRTRQDNQPLCWSEIFVPERFAAGRDLLGLNNRSVYEGILEREGLRLEYVEQDISATHVLPSLASLLNAEPSGAALLVKRRYVGHTGAVFEISFNFYPAGRYSVKNVIRQRA
jgi:GntR family transcriptional regulator